MSQARQIKARLIVPWRQIPCARKFAGTSTGCVLPPNQAIRICRAEKSNAGTTGSYFEVRKYVPGGIHVTAERTLGEAPAD